MELTPEEREKIYLEEKARVEARWRYAGPIWLKILGVIVLSGVVIYLGYNLVTLGKQFDETQKHQEEMAQRHAEAQRAFEGHAIAAPTSPKTQGNLEFQVLKLSQLSSVIRIDFRLTNKSDTFIAFWEIKADLYDAQGHYLTDASKLGSNLRPNQSVTESFMVAHVNAQDVARLKASIGRLLVNQPGGDNVDAAPFFALKEIQP
jgi:hypothetical protein